MTWPPSAAALARVEYLRKLLSQGTDNPLTHAETINRLHGCIHDTTDLRPTRAQVNNDPTEWLVKSLQRAAETASIPGANVPGPVLSQSILQDNYFDGGDLALHFEIFTRYIGAPHNPVGATQVKAILSTRTPSGIYDWTSGWDWSLNIGDTNPLHVVGHLHCDTADLWQIRYHFSNAANTRLSDYSFTDEMETDTV
jgi:hypothetical protein